MIFSIYLACRDMHISYEYSSFDTCFIMHYEMFDNSKPLFYVTVGISCFWSFLCCHQVQFMRFISTQVSQQQATPKRKNGTVGMEEDSEDTLTKVWVVLVCQPCLITCHLFLHFLHDLLKISREW